MIKKTSLLVAMTAALGGAALVVGGIHLSGARRQLGASTRLAPRADVPSTAPSSETAANAVARAADDGSADFRDGAPETLDALAVAPPDTARDEAERVARDWTAMREELERRASAGRLLPGNATLTPAEFADAIAANPRFQSSFADLAGDRDPEVRREAAALFASFETAGARYAPADDGETPTDRGNAGVPD